MESSMEEVVGSRLVLRTDTALGPSIAYGDEDRYFKTDVDSQQGSSAIVEERLEGGALWCDVGHLVWFLDEASSPPSVVLELRVKRAEVGVPSILIEELACVWDMAWWE